MENMDFAQTVLGDINSLRTTPTSLNEQFEKMKIALTRFKGMDFLVKDIESFLRSLSNALPVGQLVYNELLNKVAEKHFAAPKFAMFATGNELILRANEFIEGYSIIEQVADDGADGPHDVINKTMFNKMDKEKKNRKVLLNPEVKEIGFAHRKINGENQFVAVLVDKCVEKKVVVAKKTRYQGNTDELRAAFDLFDVMHIGKIDPKECIAAMRTLSFDTKNPALFEVMSEMDTPENRQSLVDFDQFVDHITSRIENTDTKEGIRRIFNLFIDDPTQDTITLATLRKICRELGETQSNDELTDLISRASGNGTELTFDEFYAFMVRKNQSKA